MNILIKWFVSALALLIAAYLIPGIMVESFYIALIVALLLGLVNAVLKPILIVLTLPINILTLGLFTFVINGLLFWFLASFVRGFNVDSFWTAVVGAIVVSLVSWFGNQLIGKSNYPSQPAQGRGPTVRVIDEKNNQ